MAAENYGRSHRGGSENAQTKELVKKLRASLTMKSGGRKTTEASVRKQKAEIDTLNEQLDQVGCQLKECDLQKVDLEKQLKDAQATLEKSKEELQAIEKKADEAREAFIKVNGERIKAEGRIMTLEGEVLTAVEGFKNFAEGIKWCQELLVESVIDALEAVFTFIKDKAPGITLTGCPYYEELEVDDSTENGDGEALLK